MKPIIGIIICGIKENRQFVSTPYIDVIIRSGGIPIIIPCSVFKLDSRVLRQLPYYFETYYKYCNGFLFCGGGDISPILFDQSPLNNAGETDLNLDLFQISFMEYLLVRDKPVLGICRGMQVMNAASGGTLYQDLSLRQKHTISHMQNSLIRSAPSHRVVFKKNSTLYDIYGISELTNSFHHQSIHRLGTGIFDCGHTEDGVIEAIEVKKHPFAIGLQWHPECMYDVSKASRYLFHIFISVSSHTNPANHNQRRIQQ